MNTTSIIAVVIFTVTYAGIIFTRLPWMNIDRPSAAFFGAVAMIVFGVLSFDDAIRAIDFNTIALLLGMMIIIATLEIDGFFSLIAQKTIAFSKTRRRLLAIVVFVTGVSSAFLVNDAVVLLFTPVVIAICRSSRLDPIPYLIAEILASNAGSAMTITGNPQNMLIGINSGIPYGLFLAALFPISLIGMMVIVLAVMALYPGSFKDNGEIDFHEKMNNYDYRSMKFSVPVFAAVTALFFISRRIGLSIPVIALVGGALVLIFGRIKPTKIVKEVDWVLLLFFASLFIVVRGFESTGLMEPLLGAGALTNDFHGVAVIHGISLFLSQIVSNVPLTVVMLPVMKSAASDMLWLSLASASTLAGNATIIGAMANLIVIESAGSQGVRIGFREFLKTGLIVTLVTMAISMGIIYAEMSLGFIE